MENIHRVLARDGDWTLVHLDRRAWVYVKNVAVDAAWLDKNGYAIYHPLSLPSLQLDSAIVPRLTSELKRAAAAAPDYVRVRLDLAFIYAVAGENTLAWGELEVAKHLDPENPVVWNRIGNVALAAGNYQEAVSAFERLRQLAPDNPASYINLGRANAAAGERQQAVAAFEGAISLNPNYVEAYEGLFEMYAREQSWGDAQTTARRVVSAQPGDYRGHYLLAVACAALGKTEDALKHAQTALRFNRRAGEVFLFLADIHAQLQDYATAREYLERALSIDPNSKAALDMRERLRSSQP
jgi:tetratricopeptide (TPR) repeat protein